MIKFFRRIRYKLMEQNKTGKYFTYAIGEIVLVVIGILIALSVNNWNENQKLKSEEIKLLQNFHSSITGDIALVNRYAKEFDYADESIFILLKHMEEDLPYHDSLGENFKYSTALWSPKIDQEVFETLTSTDLNIISNDSLKKELINYYSFAKRTFDVRMNRYANIIEEASQNIFNTRFNAMWNNTWNDPHYIDKRSEHEVKPIDYDALKKDQEYQYFLQTLKNQLFWYVRSPLKEAGDRGQQLLTHIELELLALEE